MAHRRHKPKYVSFLIIPDGKTDPKTYKIKRSILTLILAAVVIVFALIILGAATYWKVAAVAIDYTRLEEENFNLRKSLKRIEDLQNDLNTVQLMDKKIRASLDGYVSIMKSEPWDSSRVSEINFSKMDAQEERTIFNSIPSLMPVDGFMTRGFDPHSILADPHLGIDIAAPTGSAVRAAANGIVMFSGWTDYGGNVLILQHDYGFSTVYKHNEFNLVSPLERVTKGQVIALLGNTGKITSGAHLHFEIWRNQNPVDPMLYLTENSANKN
jgi:murein DD-endopeptidase MepM/ murein hydrolase activator NlpD